jgi:hypothetical protein
MTKPMVAAVAMILVEDVVLGLGPRVLGAFGWGFGCAVVTHPLANGPFGAGWDGGLGTSMWWDAQAQSVGILLTQRSAYPSMNPVYLDLWRAIRG